jgi:hypothetical protein
MSHVRSHPLASAVASISFAAVLALCAVGCRPAQCGARNEPCCNGGCLGAMTCVSDVCRAPCAGPLEACDAVTGTGCDAGSTCRLEVSGDTIVPACAPGEPGPGMLDTPCASTSDCAAGLFCYRERCRFLCCDRDADCADRLQFCVPYEGLGLCDGDEGCDVFSGSGCAEGYGCFAFIVEGGGYSPTCLRPGTVATFGACSEHADCVPGHRCVRQGADAVCLPMCDAGHRCTVGACTELARDNGFGVCVP